jgi:hypothetical protein
MTVIGRMLPHIAVTFWGNSMKNDKYVLMIIHHCFYYELK